MRKLFFLISNSDLASKNMGYFLRKNFGDFTVFDVELMEIDKLHLYLTDDDIKELGINGPILILSSHASERKIRSLTVHTPGNFKENLYGGEPEKISVSNPILQTVLLRSLYKNNPFEEFQISLEVTHHGPSLDVPITFYEIGSTEGEWKNKKIAEFMIENLKTAIPEYFDNLRGKELRLAFGVGGPHYAPNFTRLVIQKGNFIGHIMPKYNFNPRKEIFEQLVEKNFPKKANICIIDWKGLKREQREIVIKYCKGKELEILRV